MMMWLLKKKWVLNILISVLIIAGIFLRFYHIEFGLPHSFYADEPEITELAIKYTYEFRDIVGNNNFYKLIPISYVYGTFPSYLFTIAVMGFSKFLNTFNISFDKTTLFIFMRILNALISLILVAAVAILYNLKFKDKLGTIIVLFILLFNWKLIVHAHYVNPDLLLTTLLSLSFVTFYIYYTRKFDNLFTVLTGIFFGLAVGTKITALISLPLFLYVYIKRKDFLGILGFLVTTIGTFGLSNPFSIIFIKDFAYRIFTMLSKEGGLVFDSVDYSPFKYFFGMEFIMTLPIFIISLYGFYLIFRSLSNKDSQDKKGIAFDIFLIGNIIFYMLFFSIQSRRVDRWLLPIVPIVSIYASYGLSKLYELTNRHKLSRLYTFFISYIVGYYLFFPVVLLTQFNRNTPKSEAYLWAKENLPLLSKKLSYTEEGLDPLNKLPFADISKFNVYESENAQFFLPKDPMLYDYVFVSSRSMQNFKNPVVRRKYPYYAQMWDQYENTLLDSSKFELIKEFVLPKPNLIPLSDVFVYKKITSITPKDK